MRYACTGDRFFFLCVYRCRVPLVHEHAVDPPSDTGHAEQKDERIKGSEEDGKDECKARTLPPLSLLTALQISYHTTPRTWTGPCALKTTYARRCYHLPILTFSSGPVSIPRQAAQDSLQASGTTKFPIRQSVADGLATRLCSMHATRRRCSVGTPLLVDLTVD